ncbi:MAG: hypothetical protein V3W34_20535 [Phycisphaerae bacterium]
MVSTGAAGNIGSLTINPSLPSSDDFEVTIANGANPGAANVGSIVLDETDPDWTGYSTLDGETISGNLTGALTVVEDSGGSGGSASAFTIEGDALGAITLPNGDGFTIEGDITGTVSMGEGAGFVLGGLLDVGPSAFHVDTITNGTMRLHDVDQGTNVSVDDFPPSLSQNR